MTPYRPIRLAVSLCALAFLVSAGIASKAWAAAPTAQQIVAASGDAAAKVLIVSQVSLPETGREAYAAKLRMGSGEYTIVVVDGEGRPIEGRDVLLAAEAKARRQRYGGLGSRLLDDLKTRASDELVPVAVWTKVRIDRPQREEVLANATSRATFDTKLRGQLAAAADPIVAWLNQHAAGRVNTLTSGDLTSPLLRARVPASLVPELGSLANVDVVDLDSPISPLSTAWFGATNVLAARVITTGWSVSACVVENDRPDDTTYLLVSDMQTPDGFITDDLHSRRVMGIISNTWGPSVTDASLYMGNYAYAAMTTGIDWCRGQGTPVMNFSIVENPYTGLMDRQLDWYTMLPPFPLMVAGSGNQGGLCENCTKNGLVVGASADMGTDGIFDDVIAPFSAYGNRDDYELPHLVAPGVCIDSADLPCVAGATNLSSGTSFSTPQVTGAAMLMLAHNPYLSGWPEGFKALLMATATANIDGDRFSSLPASVDMKDGVGLLNTGAAVALAGEENRVWCNNNPQAKGFMIGGVDLRGAGFSNCQWNLAATRNGRMRVIVNWDATASCTVDGSDCSSDVLDADIDLHVYDSSGQTLLCSSLTFGSSWEGCEFPVTAGSTYAVKLNIASANQDKTYYGLAWTDIPMPEAPTAQVTLQGAQETYEDEFGTHSAIRINWQASAGSEGIILAMGENPTALPPVVDGQAIAQMCTLGSWRSATSIGNSNWKCLYRGTDRSGTGVEYDVNPNSIYRIFAIPFNEFRLGMPSYRVAVSSANPISVPDIPSPVGVPAAPRPFVLGLAVILVAAGATQLKRRGGHRATRS